MAGAAAASDPIVAHAVRDALQRGNAADAVVTGVFVAAAANPAVLLGPVQLLAGGGGAGVLALDGRPRQPGLGVPRPRGFLSEEGVPASARVAVPGLPAALAAVLGALGKLSLRRALGPAVEYAGNISSLRAGVLEALAQRGPTGFWDDPATSELLDVAGRPNGGLLTREDLAAVRPTLERCDAGRRPAPGVIRVPWSGEDDRLDGSNVHVVAAADGQGLVIVACYERPMDEGVAIPGLGLIAPSFAEPVMRGKRRPQPGLPLRAAAPIALYVTRARVELAIGVSGLRDADRRLAAALTPDDSGVLAIQTVRAAADDGRLVAVASSRDAARVLASA